MAEQGDQRQDYLPGMVPPRGGTLRRRGIYLLPNLFTTAALFAGFYAIVQAMNGRFGESAVAIFVAGLLDGLDGRVARLTRMFGINVIGSFICAREAVKRMSTRHGGSGGAIVNLSSVAAKLGGPGW